MLAADKLLLTSRIKQNATQLKEKEFALHNVNFSTVGTQAAVIAGFTMTALIEIRVPGWCLNPSILPSHASTPKTHVVCVAQSRRMNQAVTTP